MHFEISVRQYKEEHITMDKETKERKNTIPTIRSQIKEAISEPEIKSEFGLETQTDVIHKASAILDEINEQNARKKLHRLTFNNLISIYLGEEADKNVVDSHSRTLRRQCDKMGISEFLNKVSGDGKRYIYQKKDLNFIRILHKEQQKNIVKAGAEAIIQWFQVSDILENLLERAYNNGYIKDDEETLEKQLEKAKGKLWEYYELGTIPQDMGLMMDYGESLEYILSMKDNPEKLRKFLYSDDSKDSVQVSDSSKSQKPVVDSSISFNEFARTQEAGISKSDKEKTLKIANRLYEIYKDNKKNIKNLKWSEEVFLYKSNPEDSGNQEDPDNQSGIEELENCIARIKSTLREKKITDIDEILLEWDYINALIHIFDKNNIAIPDDLEEIIADGKRIIFSQILNKYAEWLSQKKYIRVQGNLYHRYMRICEEKMLKSFKN